MRNTNAEKKYLDIVYPKFKGNYPILLVNHLAKKLDLKPGMRLLDIGAGAGTHTAAFNKLGLRASGITKQDVNLESGMIPYRDNSFDVVFCKSVLEHIRNTNSVMTETLRVLKPGGMAIFMTPDWETDYKFFWDDPTHIKPFTKKGLLSALMLYGFTDIDCKHFWALPFLWRYPFLEPLRWIISLLPSRFKWKDKKHLYHRVLVRHSKERVLLCTARKRKENIPADTI